VESHVGSPPSAQIGFFPHDLDDISESQADHQYFTYSGGSRQPEQRPHLSSLFHRVGVAYGSLDDYTIPRHSLDSQNSGANVLYRQRFDNSSFVKSLSINDEDNNASPKDNHILQKKSKEKDHQSHNHHHHHHHHHHHSIQEMLKNFGKKVHIWPRKSHDASSVCTSPQNDPQKTFRTRSKSLDVDTLKKPNPLLEDCGATYKIFDKIVKEGKSNIHTEI